MRLILDEGLFIDMVFSSLVDGLAGRGIPNLMVYTQTIRANLRSISRDSQSVIKSSAQMNLLDSKSK